VPREKPERDEIRKCGFREINEFYGDLSTITFVDLCTLRLRFRSMNIQELGEQYREKTNEDLLRLALTPEELTPEANLILTG